MLITAATWKSARAAPVVVQERDHLTGEIERLKAEEAQAALEKKRAAEALMVEVHRSNAEQVRST